MSAGSEQVGQVFQPESVLRWSVSQQVRIWTPDAETASQTAQRLADTFFPPADQADEQRTDPRNAELFRVDPDAEETLVSIWMPLSEERTEPDCISFDFSPQADGAVTIRVGRQSPVSAGERAIIAEALTGTEAVLQAADRSLDLSFATGETALKYLGSPEVALPKDVIVTYVRRQVFKSLAMRITEHAGGIARMEETFPPEVEEVFGLVNRYAPHVSDDLTTLRSKIESQGPQPNDYGGTLFGLACKAYFDLQDETKRMQLIKEATLLLRAFYKDEKSKENRLESVIFDRSHHGYDLPVLQEKELVVPFAWTGKLVDPRISVAADLFIRGNYDLNRHHFAVNDEVANPRTQLRLTIGRSTDSALHGEQELAPLMEKQWRQLGGSALTAEQLEDYTSKLAQSTVTQPTTEIPKTPPELRARRSSGSRLGIHRPIDSFFR